MNEKEIKKEIEESYLEILGRKPDTVGLDHFLNLMKNSNYTKQMIKEDLHMSDEFMLDYGHKIKTNYVNMKIDKNKIFFIVGIGRSGTTILQELLFSCYKLKKDQNNRDEHGYFCNLKESKYDKGTTSCWYPVRKNNDFSYLEKFFSENWYEEFFIEKTPDSVYSLDKMKENFPNSNVIFLKRDPYSLVLSQLNFVLMNSDEIEKNYHLKILVSKKKDMGLNTQEYWAKRTLLGIQKMEKFKNKFDNRVIIKYESILNEFENEFEKLKDKFGVIPGRHTKKILDRPSASGRKNSHKIKEITNGKALEYVKEARKLWGYE